MKFRRAVIEDIEMMSEIRLSVTENVLSNPAKVTRQMYEDYLERFGRGWVCEIEDRIVGFSYANKVDASIWALFVHPQFDGLGAGKGLLKLATDWLFELGAEKGILSNSVNTRADRFYSAQAWVRGDVKDERDVDFTLWRNSVSA